MCRFAKYESNKILTLTNWLTLTVRRVCLCLGVIKAFFCRYTLVQNTLEWNWIASFQSPVTRFLPSFLALSLSLALTRFVLLLFFALFLFLFWLILKLSALDHIKQIYKQFVDILRWFVWLLLLFLLLYILKKMLMPFNLSLTRESFTLWIIQRINFEWNALVKIVFLCIWSEFVLSLVLTKQRKMNFQRVK